MGSCSSESISWILILGNISQRSVPLRLFKMRSGEEIGDRTLRRGHSLQGCQVPTINGQVLNPPTGGSADHVDRRGV